MGKQIRKFLRIDTWGMDLFRVKRRLGQVVQEQAELSKTNDESVDIVDHNFEMLINWVQELEDRVECLEVVSENFYPGELACPMDDITDGEDDDSTN